MRSHPAPSTPRRHVSRLWPTEEIRQQLVRRIPVGRFGREEEVADACAYLVSDYASYITGDVLTVDGGALARARHVRGTGQQRLVRRRAAREPLTAPICAVAVEHGAEREDAHTDDEQQDGERPAPLVETFQHVVDDRARNSRARRRRPTSHGAQERRTSSISTPTTSIGTQPRSGSPPVSSVKKTSPAATLSQPRV